MSRSVYMGQNMGFVQDKYFDQVATALAGDLAYAGDYNLVDTGPVSINPVDGVDAILQVGLAITLDPCFPARQGAPSFVVSQLDSSSTTTIAIDGISVRSQVVHTNANLESGWWDGEMATYLSGRRVGGRIWVVCTTGGAYPKAPVYVRNMKMSGTGPIGSFGAATAGGMIEVTNAKWASTAMIGELALLELTA